MDGISPIGALVSRIQELDGSQASPSIADVAGTPDEPGPDTPATSDFTAKYEMAVLCNALRASADQSLTLIQMFDGSHSPVR